MQITAEPSGMKSGSEVITQPSKQGATDEKYEGVDIDFENLVR